MNTLCKDWGTRRFSPPAVLIYGHLGSKADGLPSKLSLVSIVYCMMTRELTAWVCGQAMERLYRVYNNTPCTETSFVTEKHFGCVGCCFGVVLGVDMI